MAIDIKIKTKTILADFLTPIHVYAAFRDKFAKTILLESSDYHNLEDSRSFICIDPIAEFKIQDRYIIENYPNGHSNKYIINSKVDIIKNLNDFMKSFRLDKHENFNGLFGYCSYDAVVNFEDIEFDTSKDNNEQKDIAKLNFSFFRYVVVFDHFYQSIKVIENLLTKTESKIDEMLSIMNKRGLPMFKFKAKDDESSNMTDKQFIDLVKKGKQACRRGDVYQIVLSRKFEQSFIGDDLNVYRALRSINPSPYLFYFDLWQL